MEEDNLDWILCRFCRMPFRGKNLLSIHKQTEHSHLVQIKPKRKPIQNEQEEEITQIIQNSRKRKNEEIPSTSIPILISTPPKKAKLIPALIPIVSNSTTTSPMATGIITKNRCTTSTIKPVAESPCPVTRTDNEKNKKEATMSNNKPSHYINNVLNSFQKQILNLVKRNPSTQQKKEQETSPSLPSSSVQTFVNNKKLKYNNHDNQKVSLNINANEENEDDEIEITRTEKLVNKNEEEKNTSIIFKTKVPKSNDLNDHANENTIELTYHVQSIKQEEEVEVALDENYVQLEVESEHEEDPLFCSSGNGSSSSNDFGLDIQMEKYFQCEDCYQNFLTMENFNLHKRLKCGKLPELDSSSANIINTNINNNNNISGVIGDGSVLLIQAVDKDNNKIVKLIKVQLVEKNLAFSRFKIIQTNFKIKDKSDLIPIVISNNNNNFNSNNNNNIHNDNNNIIIIDNANAKDKAPDTRFIIKPIIPIPNNDKNDSMDINSTKPIAENKGGKPYPKVPLSFTSLTALAIRTRGNLGVVDIYKFIMEEFPYFSTIPKGNWRNSVRHTVASCKYFQKVKKDVPDTRRAIWQLDPERNKLIALESRLRRECIKNQKQILQAMRNPDKFQTMIPP